MLFKQVWLLLRCGASCLFSCLKTSVNASHLVSQCLVEPKCKLFYEPRPPPSQLYMICSDHDLWPSCWVGVGVEAEDNIPPQKSMHINNAAAFSLMCVPVLVNYCVICCSGIHSTPGWLIQTPQNDAETQLLCSDPEYLWRRPWSDSWVILHLLPEFMTHAGLQYPQNVTVQRHIYLPSVSWVSYWRQIEIESSASSADLSGIMCPFMRAVVECLGLFESLCCLINYDKLCILMH